MAWMMSRREAAIGALGGALAGALQPLDALAQCGSGGRAAVRLGRGVAIHAAYNWPDMTPDGNYRWPPFQNETRVMSDDHLASLRRAGFDFIRLTVNPRIFIANVNSDRFGQAQNVLQDGLSRLLRHGFNVIVDFHSISRDPENATDALVSPPGNIHASHVGDLIERFAGWLAHAPAGRVAMELWNEPAVTDPQAAAWDHLQQSWHQRARRAAPGLTLIVAGTHTNDPGLIRLNGCAYNDGNTYFTFHFYDPTPFTLQGMPMGPKSVDPLQFFDHVRYPSTPQDVQANVSAARQKLAAKADFAMGARAQADTYLQTRNQYLAQRGNPGWIAARFDAVAAWARQNGITPDHVLLGEFGVMRPGVDPASRLRWLADVRQAAERHGFPWSLWLYERADNMGLVMDNTSFALDPGMLRALGLNPA